MDKYIIKFDDTEIEEYKFHQPKSPISINDIDISKIIVSNKLFFSKQDFKYFIGYKDAKKIRSFFLFYPKTSINKRDFDKTICMYFLKKDENFFYKYNEIWEKVSNIVKKKKLIVNLYI